MAIGRLTDLERKEVLAALAYVSKKWRKSIAKMPKHGRHDEVAALWVRATVLDCARRKIREGVNP